MGKRGKKNGDTYFRAGGHYHRPRKLNYCVRYGNRCDLSGVVAKESPLRSSSEALIFWGGSFGKARVGYSKRRRPAALGVQKTLQLPVVQIAHFVPPLPLGWHEVRKAGRAFLRSA